MKRDYWLCQLPNTPILAKTKRGLRVTFLVCLVFDTGIFRYLRVFFVIRVFWEVDTVTLSTAFEVAVIGNFARLTPDLVAHRRSGCLSRHASVRIVLSHRLSELVHPEVCWITISGVVVDSIIKLRFTDSQTLSENIPEFACQPPVAVQRFHDLIVLEDFDFHLMLRWTLSTQNGCITTQIHLYNKYSVWNRRISDHGIGDRL